MTNTLLKKRFRQFLPVVIDVETSGLNDDTHALLELAAVFLEYQDQILTPSHTLHFHIKPFQGAEFDPKAMEIHEIRPDHPFRMAVDEKDCLEQLNQAIESELSKHQCRKAIITGHNPAFDLGFIQKAGKRSAVKPLLHSFSAFDTATLSALIFGQTVLAKALTACHITHDAKEAHSALYDAKQTAKLFCYIINHTRFDPSKASNLPARIKRPYIR